MTVTLSLRPFQCDTLSSFPIPNCRSFYDLKVHKFFVIILDILMSSYIITTINLDLSKRSTI